MPTNNEITKEKELNLVLNELENAVGLAYRNSCRVKELREKLKGKSIQEQSKENESTEPNSFLSRFKVVLHRLIDTNDATSEELMQIEELI
ncbi:hypothetical protein [Draconibacterium mangrovi]|uniref:hypothetical protein n=1 Tax=Draconibacterium mangrovi TaxID=2697469 RepID=UPI0013CF781B|nr:hypothetical protein [Draconibacterium mangrovi]